MPDMLSGEVVQDRTVRALGPVAALDEAAEGIAERLQFQDFRSISSTRCSAIAFTPALDRSRSRFSAITARQSSMVKPKDLAR